LDCLAAASQPRDQTRIHGATLTEFSACRVSGGVLAVTVVARRREGVKAVRASLTAGVWRVPSEAATLGEFWFWV